MRNTSLSDTEGKEIDVSAVAMDSAFHLNVVANQTDPIKNFMCILSNISASYPTIRLHSIKSLMVG